MLGGNIGARKLGFAVCLLAGCIFGSSVGEGRKGNPTGTPAKKARPDAAFLSRCGNGALTQEGSATLVRRPYLQQVTERSTHILWTAKPESASSVLVTTPERKVVAKVAAARQAVEGDPGFVQLDALVPNLSPNTLYCYELRNEKAALTSRAGFRTAPAAGASTPVRIVVFGDSGNGSIGQQKVRDVFSQYPFDLVLITGDVAYQDGTRQQFEDHFFSIYAELLRSIPFFPTTGNHEYHTADAAPFREVFALPENGGADGRERWYSFNYGDVHFVALDTEMVGPAQAAWLGADLASNTRPWTIVYAHKPPYSAGEHGSNEPVRNYFVPLIEKFRVPLFIAGHDHDYERTQPILGTTYIVTGGGGRGTRPVSRSAQTAYSEAVLHFTYIEIDSERMKIHAIDYAGREFDRTQIELPQLRKIAEPAGKATAPGPLLP